MTNKQILKKAIQRAVKNGFDMNDEKYPISKNVDTEEITGYEAIIFSHDFAKALWGEGFMPIPNKPRRSAYQIHLQEMVLKRKPLKYLEKFIGV